MNSDKKDYDGIYSFELDLKLLENFQSFGGEIVRLALALVGVVAFIFSLLSSLGEESSAKVAKLLDASYCTMVAAFIFLGLAIVFALVHRYCSADAMVPYLEYLRAEADGNTQKAARKKWEHRWRLKLCGPFLGFSTLALVVGACLIIRIFFIAMFAF